MLMNDFCLNEFGFSEDADQVMVGAVYVQVADAARRRAVEVSDEKWPADLHGLLAVLRSGEVARTMSAGGFRLELERREVKAGRVVLTYTGRREDDETLTEADLRRLASRYGVPVSVLLQRPLPVLRQMLDQIHAVDAGNERFITHGHRLGGDPQ